jgi:S-adenosylmethionine:tRNA ribosyltransferase-isomerase
MSASCHSDLAVACRVVRLADFDYDLPADRIAQTPVEPRDAARLLVDRGSRGARAPPRPRPHDLLRPGDLLVVNETKVIPARSDSGASRAGRPRCCCSSRSTRRGGPGRRWSGRLASCGGRLLLGCRRRPPIVEIGGRTASGDTFLVTLVGTTDDGDDALEVLDATARCRCRRTSPSRSDRPDRYQTVYAREPGSAAAPTAGLHFTPELLGRLQATAASGDRQVELVVGLDTFRPIVTDDPLEHRMHTERYRVPEATMEAGAARPQRVVAVGTTAVRALESAAGRASSRVAPTCSSIAGSTGRSSTC